MSRVEYTDQDRLEDSERREKIFVFLDKIEYEKRRAKCPHCEEYEVGKLNIVSRKFSGIDYYLQCKNDDCMASVEGFADDMSELEKWYQL